MIHSWSISKSQLGSCPSARNSTSRCFAIGGGPGGGTGGGTGGTRGVVDGGGVVGEVDSGFARVAKAESIDAAAPPGPLAPPAPPVPPAPLPAVSGGVVAVLSHAPSTRNPTNKSWRRAHVARPSPRNACLT